MKKQSKKLTLNRETVKNLQPGSLRDVDGGGTLSCVWTCFCYSVEPSCPSHCPCPNVN